MKIEINEDFRNWLLSIKFRLLERSEDQRSPAGP